MERSIRGRSHESSARLLGPARIEAIGAQVAAARAALLPQIRLTGALGRQAGDFGDLLESAFNVWSLAADLLAPLFQGGRLRAQVAVARAQLAEALAAYRDLVLESFLEVEPRSLKTASMPPKWRRPSPCCSTLRARRRADEQRETLGGLAQGFLFALLAIYALLAIPFRSYVQPLLVMAVIPFGFVGALLGHLAMGLDFSILSMFGMVALTGVMINDSLVMVDFINQRRDGRSLEDSTREAGMARFRPVLLTSRTTFAALAPLLAERSVQAQFLIPTAASLACGVLFATVITLILVPVCYALLDDAQRILPALWRRAPVQR